ncbi:Hypothetical predicted protein [Mytilus galloprovincialis]|uniref:Uncharacterized protein n=1 Tax=Mytilus galloprovincialis TaxID=29158 RepID=A0A8B6FDU1_MYTGA|nr:Hypothetical predicted protein [Mytilus galloprovincialis]
MQEKSNGDYEDYVDRLSSSLQKCHEFARKSLKKSSEHQKRLHNLRKHEHTFKTGDLVYAIDTAKKKGKSPKLQAQWKGHYVDSKIQNAETEQKEIISLDSGTLSPVSSGSKTNVIVTKLTESLNGAIIPKISTKTDDSSDSSESRTQASGSHVNHQMTKEEHPP